MSLIDRLTPKDTEEIKPNFWIQKRKSGKYHRILPFAWNGKWLWKEQLRTIFSIRFFATMLILGFLFWSYTHDQAGINQNYFDILANKDKFCARELNSQEIFDLYGDKGLGINDPNANLSTTALEHIRIT